MSENLYRIGEIVRLDRTIDAADAFTVDSVTCTIYDANGNAVVSAGAGSTDSTQASTTQTAYYLWNTAARLAGDYTYILTCVIASEKLLLHGNATLLPLFSKLDRWVQRIRDWVQENREVEGGLGITERQYREAAKRAVREFSRRQPRELVYEQVLTAGGWEYDLPPQWTTDFSDIRRLEYPVEDDEQTRTWLKFGDWEFDERLLKWRFTSAYPSSTESARLYYTTEHRLDDYQETVPEQFFESVCQHAAAEVLYMLANKAPQTSNTSADAVEYRTKEQQYAARAKEMSTQALSRWGGVQQMVIGHTPF